MITYYVPIRLSYIREDYFESKYFNVYDAVGFYDSLIEAIKILKGLCQESLNNYVIIQISLNDRGVYGIRSTDQIPATKIISYAEYGKYIPLV